MSEKISSSTSSGFNEPETPVYESDETSIDRTTPCSDIGDGEGEKDAAKIDFGIIGKLPNDETMSSDPSVLMNQDYQKADDSLSLLPNRCSEVSYGKTNNMADMNYESNKDKMPEIDLQSNPSVRYQIVDDDYRKIVEEENTGNGMTWARPYPWMVDYNAWMQGAIPFCYPPVLPPFFWNPNMPYVPMMPPVFLPPAMFPPPSMPMFPYSTPHYSTM